jgi:hypothetical protein
MKRLLFLSLIVLILLCGVKTMAGEIELKSSVFKEEEMIPKNIPVMVKMFLLPFSGKIFQKKQRVLLLSAMTLMHR